MNSHKTIQDELISLGSGLPVANSPVFSVPEGYFEGLAATVLAKAKGGDKAVAPEIELAELSPLLAGLPKAMPYSVPSSYFQENLETSAFAEEETEPAFLAAGGKAMPYHIPQAYFETLPEQILAQVAAPKAKVVPLFRRTWMRVAAAAAVCGALLIGGLRLLNNKPDAGTVAGTQPAQTVQTQVAKAEPVLENAIKQASTKELEEFIETVDAAPEQPLKKDLAATGKGEVAELLKDVSVNEMESFLSALPQAEEDLPATNKP